MSRIDTEKRKRIAQAAATDPDISLRDIGLRFGVTEKVVAHACKREGVVRTEKVTGGIGWSAWDKQKGFARISKRIKEER